MPRETTTQKRIRRTVNGQRYNGAGNYGSTAGGRYVSERDSNGRATNSGNRNRTLGTREQRRADLRAAFADAKFGDGTGRAFSKG